MHCSIFYHHEVSSDISSIPQNIKSRIQRAEERLLSDPGEYGEPLRRGLQGYRKLQVGDYHIIYKVRAKEKEIVVLKIGHRRGVYNRRERREFDGS